MITTITTEDLQSWLQQDTTKYFLKSLYNQREISKEELVGVNCQQDDFIRGRIAAIQDILQTDPKEITKNFVDTIDKYYSEVVAVEAPIKIEEDEVKFKVTYKKSESDMVIKKFNDYDY